MKKIGISCLLLLFSVCMMSQTNTDSLIHILNTERLTVDERFDLYRNISHAFYVAYNSEKNIYYAEQGLKLAEKEKNKFMISKFNEYIGYGYVDKGSYDTATVFYEKAMHWAIESKNKEQEAGMYISMSALYGNQGKYASAVEYSLKALPLVEALEDRQRNISVLYNIGVIYSNLNNFERAIYYLEQAKAMAEKFEKVPQQKNIYYQLGLIFKDKEEFDEALQYAQKSLEISRSLNDRVYKAMNLQLLSQINYRKFLPNYDLALQYAKESAQIAEESGFKAVYIASLNILSNVYREKRNFKKSEEMAFRAWELDSINIMANTNNVGFNVLYNIALSNMHLGNKEKSGYFFKRYHTSMLEFNDKSIHNSLADMEISYETQKKELHITALEKEKQLYVVISAAGIIILLMFLGILFYRHRTNLQKRKMAEQQVKQLEQEKQLIATQAILDGETAERSRLARDLHDGLGSLLSVMKLNLGHIQSYSVLDDEDTNRFGKALAVLDESIEELRRVAHHIMPETLIRYGLNVSIEDFCRAIPIAQFQYLGEDIRLDNRLEVMLYRCVYELINNAIKHADASVINIQLQVDTHVVALTVYDNGKGFDVNKTGSGTGLENIRTRVSAYNGKMQVQSEPGKGTEIIIEIESE